MKKRTSKAKVTALESYSKAVKNYKAKLKRLSTKSDIDFTTWFDNPPSMKQVRKLNTRDIKVLIRDLAGFNMRGGEKIIKYNNQYVPKAYKEQYQRAKSRFNKNTKRLEKYKLNKIKKPDSDFVNFLEFSKGVIKKASPQYWNRRRITYKSNYLKAVKDSLSFTEAGKKLEKMIEAMSADKLIDAYYKKGNEDLGINNIYPGDRDQAQATAEYLIERWKQVT